MSRKTPGQDDMFTVEALEAVEKLIPLAERKGVSLSEFSLAWLMQSEGVSSAVLGARKIEYLRAGIKACELSFSKEELDEIDEIVPPGTSVSNFFEPNAYRQLRGGYDAAIRGERGTGAYIPVTASLKPGEDFGRRKR